MKDISKVTWPVILLFACSIQAFAHDHETQSPSNPQPESLFNIADAWATSDEKTFHLTDLGGKPSVIAMAYTSCKDICPLIVEDMKKIERVLPASQVEQVRFVLFSLDSERDTPKKLREFAKAHNLDSSRWILVSSNPAAIRKLAVALGMKYKKTKSGDFDHSNLISVLDGAGIIQYQQTGSGDNGERAVLLLKRMLH